MRRRLARLRPLLRENCCRRCSVPDVGALLPSGCWSACAWWPVGLHARGSWCRCPVPPLCWVSLLCMVPSGWLQLVLGAKSGA